MKRGIALLEQNTPASLGEAVVLFDQAIAIRQPALDATPEDHLLAYLTAASWMNRADALTRLGQPDQITEAIRSYEQALAAMRHVPLSGNQHYRRRLAIAWMNRGLSLQALDGAEGSQRAVKSFEKAIALVGERPEHALLAACAWLNMARTYLHFDPPSPDDVFRCASRVMDLTSTLSWDDPEAAEVALKCRLIDCEAMLLAVPGATPEKREELISVAIEVAGGGVGIARSRVAAGMTQLYEIGVLLFRLALSIYQEHQPQSLAEFVMEKLDPASWQAAFADDVEMHEHALRALLAAERALGYEDFADISAEGFDQYARAVRAREFVERRLKELTSKPATI